MLMYHEDIANIGKANMYHKGWKGLRDSSARSIADTIQKYPSSNCLWAGGVRKKENFRGAQWLGLDFDEGMTVTEAMKAFGENLHVIGTTKSHQKEKQGVICDRFRVFLKFSRVCHDVDSYEETARFYIQKYGADKACKDAARFFWPCLHIVVCKYWGTLVEPIDAKDLKKKKSIAREKRQIKYRKHHKESGSMPGYIASMLRYGVNTGRNLASFQIGADLGKLGYSHSAILEIIMSSSIPYSGKDEFTIDECSKAVANGMAKGGS